MSGAIFGVNRYCSPKKQLKEMLWSSFRGNAMTQYGNDHEDDAQHSFHMWQQMPCATRRKTTTGSSWRTWKLRTLGSAYAGTTQLLAMSPDGFLVEPWVRKVTPAPLPPPRPSPFHSPSRSPRESPRKSASAVSAVELSAAASAEPAAQSHIETRCPTEVPFCTPDLDQCASRSADVGKDEGAGAPEVELGRSATPTPPGNPGPGPGPDPECANVGGPACAGGAGGAAGGPARADPDFAGTHRPNGTARETHADGVTYEVKTKRILVEYKCPWGKKNKLVYDGVDLYAMESIKKAAGLHLPCPSYYFAQCSHGMHVLGVLDDMLSAPEFTYLVVWHPAAYEHGFPEFWTSENDAKTSFTVAGEHGTIQITKVPYIRAYCEELAAAVRQFWHEDYSPALWRKLPSGPAGPAWRTCTLAGD
jgi:hypothetical protein